MKSRHSLALAAGALVAAMLPGAAAAYSGGHPGSPWSGCPSSFEDALAGPIDVGEVVDLNDDGHVCIRYLPDTKPLPGYFIVIDNSTHTS